MLLWLFMLILSIQWKYIALLYGGSIYTTEIGKRSAPGIFLLATTDG